MLVKTTSVAYSGLDIIKVDVEVNISNKGLPGFDIIGLANKSVSESKERVKTAIINSGIKFPGCKVIVNLAPADVPKDGSFYDLPICLGILSIIRGVEVPEKSLFWGECSLDGKLRYCNGAFLLGLFAKENGYTRIFVPAESAAEVAVFEDLEVYPVSDLSSLVGHLNGGTQIERFVAQEGLGSGSVCETEPTAVKNDFSQIYGQEEAKRGALISASGGHNMFMVGPPGSGKSMIARATKGILPPLTESEAIEVTKVMSASGNLAPGQGIVKDRQFRNPHHSISFAGLLGGGRIPKAGEVTLAHCGVLFLDELLEFPRNLLEMLRQPIEDREVTISRGHSKVTFPANFMLMAACNPCPCGYLGHDTRKCICSEKQIQIYRGKISGPIIDRFDLMVHLRAVDLRDIGLSEIGQKTHPTGFLKDIVVRSREVQFKRFEKSEINCNADMDNHAVKKFCMLEGNAAELLNRCIDKFKLSARAYFRLLKVARTITDISIVNDDKNYERIRSEDIAEAIHYIPHSW